MLKYFFTIIRWPNLLMLGGIQLLVYYKLLNHPLSTLSLTNVLMMIGITMMIGAGGYVINDYYDAPIDEINKPEKQVAGKIWSLSIVKNLYWMLTGIGFLLSVWLAVKMDLLGYLFIYPIAVGGLWLYSYSLKCKPFIGNLWVSLFCAGVVGVVALPDILSRNLEVIKPELLYYILFAFLATWLREVIKDIEDIDGDAKSNCETAVVRFGINTGKWMVIILGILLIIALMVWDNKQTHHMIKLLLLVLQGATIGSMAFVWWAKDKTYYHKASSILKLIMLVGTLILFFYK